MHVLRPGFSLHDPVFVQELRDGERLPTGRFYNYACLQSHVAEEFATGACDVWKP